MQLVVATTTGRVICTHHDTGRTHDLRLLKKSRLSLRRGVEVLADSGYQGLERLHAGCWLPHKATKRKPLSEKQKAGNRVLAKHRVVVEHVIRRLKVFRILKEHCRNRRQKHTARVNLICGIYNYELAKH